MVKNAWTYVLLVLAAGGLCLLRLTYYKKQYELINNGANFYDDVVARGYVEIGNYRFLKPDYMNLYTAFDDFINVMEDGASQEQIDRLGEAFLSNLKNKKRYFDAPMGHQNQSVYLARKSYKMFQFIKDHYKLMSVDDGPLPQKAAAFFVGMSKIDAMARDLFEKIINLFEKKHPGIKDIFYGDHKELTIVSRISRYDKTADWGIIPHRDMCALSLIWDSDEMNDESLLLCEDTKNPCLKNLQKPLRMFSQKDSITSTILFAGLGCKKANIDLDATLHAVAPINNERRHAVMSFLLVPGMYISEDETYFVDTDVETTTDYFDFFPALQSNFYEKTYESLSYLFEL